MRSSGSLSFLLLSHNAVFVPPPLQGDVEPESSGGAERSAPVRRLGTAGSAAGETSTAFLINLRFLDKVDQQTGRRLLTGISLSFGIRDR